MSAEFRRKSIFAALICVLLVFAIGAWSGPGAEKKPPSPYNDEEYKEIIAQQVGDIYQLEAWAAAVQDDFMPILPPVPEFILKQPAGPQVLPFAAKSFPPAFVSGMAGIYENSVPVYPVLVVEDPATRALTFYNMDNQAVYSLPPPAGYDPFAFLKSRWPGLFTGGANEAARRNMMQLYDPARIQVRARLIDIDNLAHWIYTKRQIEASQLSLPGGGSVEMKMMLGDAPNSNIFFTVVKRATNFVSMTIQYPSGFTNGLDVFTCNDLMAEIWGFGVKNLATTGTNVTWIDTNAWVVSGYPLRLYAAADASTDGDGDGYADGREIMVYSTDPMSSNSHPVTVSGTVSYSGIETGGVYVLFTQDTDSWSIAKSVWQASPGAYTNDEIGNGTSYWFKAFRDANGNFGLDPWEAWGVYSNSSTYVSGSLSNVDITMADVPSIWGQISYTGSATGDIHVLAVTGSNSWDETHSVTIPYIQSEDGSGGVYYVTFPVNYTLTDLPASNYWIRAYMDTDTNGTVSLLDPAGQYSSNAIPVSNRTTGINVTMAFDSDGDGMGDGWEMQHWSNLSQGGGGDTDGDGLLNSNEFAVGANPNVTDTDADGMPDKWEFDNSLNPTNATDAAGDSDGDGIPNAIEYQIGSSPLVVDGIHDLAPSAVITSNRSQSVHTWKAGYMEFGYSYATSSSPPHIYLNYGHSNGTHWIDTANSFQYTDYKATSRVFNVAHRGESFRRVEYMSDMTYVGDYDPMPGTLQLFGGEHWDLHFTCAGCYATNYASHWIHIPDGWSPYPDDTAGGDKTNAWDCSYEISAGWDLTTNDIVTNAATEIVWENITTNIYDDLVTARRRMWLENEFTTTQLNDTVDSELAALGPIEAIAWGTGVLWQGECTGTNWSTAETAAFQDLSDDEITHDQTRIQYCLTTTSAAPGQVYRTTVLHLFTPEGTNTSAVVRVTNHWAKGTGSATMLIPTNGVTIEPPTTDGTVAPSVVLLKLERTTDIVFARSGRNIGLALRSESLTNVIWSIAPTGTVGMASLTSAPSRITAAVHVGTVVGVYTVTVQHIDYPMLLDRYILNVREFQAGIYQPCDDCPTLTAGAIDPVSKALVQEAVDVSVATPGIGLSMARTYNSRANANESGLGPGWAHGYDMELVTQTGRVYRSVTGAVWKVFSEGAGAQVWFSDQGGGSYTAPFDPGYSLSGSTVTAPGGWTYTLNTNGSVSAINAPGQFRLALTYTNTAEWTRLAQVDHYLSPGAPTSSATLSFAYDQSGLLQSVLTPAGDYSATYAYTNGKLFTATVHDGAQSMSTAYTYENQAITSKTTPDGQVYSYSHVFDTNNADQVLMAATGMSGPSSKLSHSVAYPTNGVSAVTYQRDGLSLTTTNVVDTNLRQLTTVIAPGSVETLNNGYDANRNLTNTFVQGAGATMASAITYDGNNFPVSSRVSYAGGTNAAASMTWHSTLSVPATATDEDGITSTMGWTSDGQLSSISVGGVPMLTAGYLNGLPMAATNANGHAVTNSYNPAGLVTGVISAAGIWVQYQRDLLGTVTGIRNRDSAGGTQTTSFGVNNRGWVNSITYPDSLSEQALYDLAGRVTQTVDRAGRTNTIAYTVAGSVASSGRVTSNGWVGTALEYDQQLNLLTVRDELNRPVEAYILDGLERITNVFNLATQSMVISYAVGSHVSRVTRYDGSVITNAYDGGGRPSSAKYLPAGASSQAGETNLFAWTAAGRLVAASGLGGTVSNRFDFMGRLAEQDQRIQQATGITRTVTWSCDPAGNVTNAAVSSGGPAFSYRYDVDERIVTTKCGTVEFRFAYNAYSGLPVGDYCWNNGALTNSVTRSFDSMGRMTALSSTGAGYCAYTFGYDAIGLITSRINAANGETNAYTYDQLDRLASVKWTPAGTATSIVSTFQYDAAGNRTNTIVGGTATAWTYGAPNQLTSFGANTAVKYDSSGNVTSIQYSASWTNDLVWNARYELVEVRSNGTVAERYGYDALGRRTTIISAGTTNALIYDGDQVVAEYSNGVMARTYMWGPGIDNLLALTSHGAQTNTYVAIKDQLGSVVALASVTGGVVERYVYDAWGQVTVYNATGGVLSASAVGNRYLFTGREYSFRTGLYHYRARSYDPVTARFLSVDPIGISGGLNFFSYCENDPINRADPYGWRGDFSVDDAVEAVYETGISGSEISHGQSKTGPAMKEIAVQGREAALAAGESVLAAVSFIPGGRAGGGAVRAAKRAGEAVVGAAEKPGVLERVANLLKRLLRRGTGEPCIAAKAVLGEGDAVLAVVKNGRIIAKSPNMMLSHEQFVARTLGAIPDGAEVVTIGKFNGVVRALRSMTFHGNQGLASSEAQAAAQAMFR